MVRIITDTASDIELDIAEKYGVTVLPMQITFDQEVYKDKYEISVDTFYEKLIESDELPKTSQINPFQFEEVFEEIKESGDSAVVILMSSKLSGTYQSAMIAAEEYDNIYVVDTLNVAMGEQCIVRYGISLKEKGMEAKEIAEKLEEAKNKVEIIALLDTLEYLKKGGRISPAKAAIGGLLSIKPVVTVENGEVEILGKARGSKNGNNMLKELVKNAGGIDFDNPVLLGYTGTDKSVLTKYIEDSKELWEGETEELEMVRIGSTIGTHVGPGAIALGFFPKGVL